MAPPVIPQVCVESACTKLFEPDGDCCGRQYQIGCADGYQVVEREVDNGCWFNTGTCCVAIEEDPPESCDACFNVDSSISGTFDFTVEMKLPCADASITIDPTILTSLAIT